MSGQELVAEPIERKIERSSFGTPAARRRRQRTSSAEALAVLALVEEQDDWNEQGVDDVVQIGSETLLIQCKRQTASPLEGLAQSAEPADLSATSDLPASDSWKQLLRLTKVLVTKADDDHLDDSREAWVGWAEVLKAAVTPQAPASKEQLRGGGAHKDAAEADQARSFDVEAFYARNMVPARAACRRFVRDPDVVDDIVHDVFVEALYQHTGRVNGQRLSQWLQAQVRRRALDYLRVEHRRRRWTIPLAEVGEQLAIADPTPDPGEQLVHAEQRELIEAAMQGLSADDQQVLTYWMQGLTGRRLAEVLEVPVQLVHVRVHRARQRLLASLGALLVARRGPAWCEELGGLLQGWDGRMQPALRKRIVRHVQHCAACSDLEQLLTRPEQVL